MADDPGASRRDLLERARPAAVHTSLFVISTALLFHRTNSVAETDGADRTRPRLRDDDSVRLTHVAETIARSMLARGVRSTMGVYVAGKGLEEVLVNKIGHRSAERVAGRDIETEMNPAPDHAVLRFARRC